MTENLQNEDKLRQQECKQSKVQNFVPVLESNRSVKIAPKSFCKIFTRQNMQNQTNAKIPVTLWTFLNQLKPI